MYQGICHSQRAEGLMKLCGQQDSCLHNFETKICSNSRQKITINLTYFAPLGAYAIDDCLATVSISPDANCSFVFLLPPPYGFQARACLVMLEGAL
jgi:hypothetical protein